MCEKDSHNVQKNGSFGQLGSRKPILLTGNALAGKLPCESVPMSFFFGNSTRMRDLEGRIGFIARSGLPVLIEGPSGTGKEALAEDIHRRSGVGNGFTRILCRKSGPVVYPADATGNGSVDLSDICRRTNGTVFLKNVHLLSPVEQDQVLVALEQVSDFYAGNGRPAIEAARVVSSAAESLEALVIRGAWNPALYHRLSAYRIGLPVLRDRRQDIPELFGQMVSRAVNGHGVPPTVASRLLGALAGYDWPGNLRELENIARTYVATGQADEIISELGNRCYTAHFRSLLYKMKSCNLRLQRQANPQGRQDI